MNLKTANLKRQKKKDKILLLSTIKKCIERCNLLLICFI